MILIQAFAYCFVVILTHGNIILIAISRTKEPNYFYHTFFMIVRPSQGTLNALVFIWDKTVSLRRGIPEKSFATALYEILTAPIEQQFHFSQISVVQRRHELNITGGELSIEFDGEFGDGGIDNPPATDTENTLEVCIEPVSDNPLSLGEASFPSSLSACRFSISSFDLSAVVSANGQSNASHIESNQTGVNDNSTNAAVFPRNKKRTEFVSGCPNENNQNVND
eukprot:CAMPEP_0197240438 /NCGR_PEP_ID=MMETSP1429-20130617/6726_1 /TAXON_ID=49237 /ORGANISM="Chaetoceros  sp., Strain UNC1202" /LENGTH=223 /DNA_ID=CAMNT_0042700079 /DNA_START=111 /DNA_END=780 /DNA_ORIENTATION=+